MAIWDSRAVVLGLRITQASFAIIVLGLAAYVVNWWSGYWHASSPDSMNFLVFCAVWTILALLYLIMVPWRFSETGAHHPIIFTTVEALTMIFWFAGFIAAAVFLSDRVCFGSVCSAAKAATVFGAFLWILFAFTTALAVTTIGRRGRGIGSNHHHNKADPKFNVAEGV
ncbi:hypothetical protein DOTSEDRAFT_50652 [Dothistroma septosporum NZE10]|uniref:MARVEL domain-containing protein n=1 Tax=Dothistroma septosporum (strain NZE10 / CBS 128990) TaxID=675120 RepID=N1PUP7_DOTSN|nr:hypothetical protein DOTSEDRAFT_50652 [Dothistroma septosporum NZE10]